MTTIIDGKQVSRILKEEIREQVDKIKRKTGRTPGLAVVLVGNDPASQVYVRMKHKACLQTGMSSFEYLLPEKTDEDELLKLIYKLNQDENINGILIQLPLPKGINETKVIEAVNPQKDVDGFHPINAGKLLRGENTFAPCTPAGIRELLSRYDIKTAGKEVVIVGRSNIVGKPLAAMLIKKGSEGDATVTICHSRTRNLDKIIRRADVVVAAIGQPRIITADMVREGAVVIDVGVNEIGKTKGGKRILAGDVDFETVAAKTSAITPVPGGVGPMTIAMLLKNTIKAFVEQTGVS